MKTAEYVYIAIEKAPLESPTKKWENKLDKTYKQ